MPARASFPSFRLYNVTRGRQCRYCVCTERVQLDSIHSLSLKSIFLLVSISTLRYHDDYWRVRLPLVAPSDLSRLGVFAAITPQKSHLVAKAGLTLNSLCLPSEKDITLVEASLVGAFLVFIYKENWRRKFQLSAAYSKTGTIRSKKSVRVFIYTEARDIFSFALERNYKVVAISVDCTL